MDEHITQDGIAEWLANCDAGEPQDAGAERHVAGCDTCRDRIERANSLLNIAAAEVAISGDVACPDAATLAAHLDDKLDEASANAIRAHVEACDDCSQVVRIAGSDVAGSRSPTGTRKRKWFVTGTLLALAAAFAFFIFADRPSVTSIDVRTFGPPVSRSAEDGQADEFDVRVHVPEPAYVALLVVDEQGVMTFLAEKRIEGEATFGRYRVQPPDSVSSELRRIFVVILESDAPLKPRLVYVKMTDLELGHDARSRRAAMSQITGDLANQIDCRATFKPIP